MCLIYLAYHVHPRHRLIVAANRDEYHARETEAAHWWPDAPHVFAGRDAVGGGTWMGVTRTGRFAAITNYRDPKPRRTEALSRGEIVAGFLAGEDPIRDYLRRISDGGRRYNPFSFVAYDGHTLGWCSNRVRGYHVLEAGVFGLSNHLLDTPWPKVADGKAELAGLVDSDNVAVANLFALLDSRVRASDARLPNTGVGIERERWLSPRFVVGGAYGTRSSTVLLIDADGRVRFVERSYDAAGVARGQVEEQFTVEAELPIRSAG